MNKNNLTVFLQLGERRHKNGRLLRLENFPEILNKATKLNLRKDFDSDS
jgi:hypothetical protein